jgi:hypothetical protein
MPEVVVVAGVLISGISLYLFALPGSMPGLLDKVFGTRWLYAAALFRLLLGAALIASADTVAYPRAVALFGWLFVLGGLIIVALPAPALQRMVGPFGRLSPALARLWLSAAVMFGFFLVYAGLA